MSASRAAVDNHREDPLHSAGVVAVVGAREQPFEQRDDVGDRDAGADRTAVLPSVEQDRHRLMQLVPQRIADGDCVGEVPLGGAFGAQPGEEAEERLAGVCVSNPSAGVIDEVGHAGGDNGLEQCFFGGKVPVHGAGTDARPVGDLVQGDAVPGLGEYVTGGVQDTGPVALRVSPQRAVNAAGCQPGRSFRICQAGHRSDSS